MKTSLAKLLVVDDEPALRISIQAILGVEGYDVDAVSNVPDAKRRLSDRPYEVVLTDFEMPGGSGVELIKHINEQYPATMVILVTGHPDAAELKGYESNNSVVRILAKPFDPARLVRWVESTVKLARLLQATSRNAEK